MMSNGVGETPPAAQASEGRTHDWAPPHQERERNDGRDGAER